MKKSSLLTGALLLAAVAQAEKFNHIEYQVAALAQGLLLAAGGSVAVAIILVTCLVVRQRRKRQRAREWEKAFYESLQHP
ncbi:hypothetical protein [Hymenobacter sp. BT190]|uniref:hypothetical protein n=1 Tax=Hymenobacter sp. BT190 TaxID=2763505 RepID=UPI001651630F|nr:hypothetical protein [Hymenobacter sp. BT190]MBC6699551.1 hypothetical protein [Hymenobacter sp. BT190]